MPKSVTSVGAIETSPNLKAATQSEVCTQIMCVCVCVCVCVRGWIYPYMIFFYTPF